MKKPLEGVRRTSSELARARTAQHVAITRAYAEGVSLREIAEAAGVSHETVRRIVSG
jgi:DNA-directed RNA polymerase specialized sigma24 family protein